MMNFCGDLCNPFFSLPPLVLGTFLMPLIDDLW